MNNKDIVFEKLFALCVFVILLAMSIKQYVF